MEQDAVKNIFVAEYSAIAGVTRKEAGKKFDEWLFYENCKAIQKYSEMTSEKMKAVVGGA